MKCLCSFQINEIEVMEQLESYAVVQEKEYQKHLAAELDILNESNEERKSKKILDASALVGSLIRCPACGRMIFRPPHGAEQEIFQPEEL